MKNTNKNISCNCECNKIMNDIIYVYDRLPDYYTSGHLSRLYELKNTTNLSYKINQDIENQSIIDLLSENQEIAEKRKQLMNQKKSILDIKELIQQI